MNHIKSEDLNKEIDSFIRDLCKAGFGVKSEVRERLSKLLEAYKNLGYEDISSWINRGVKYHFWDFVTDEMIVKFRKESRE